MTSGVANSRKQHLAEDGEIRITVQCAANKAHAKLISLERSLGRECAETFAALLDGSSRWFIHRPGPNSPLGKCAVCGAQLKCAIEERSPEDAEPEEPSKTAAGE
jgi:hypothetical protein